MSKSMSSESESEGASETKKCARVWTLSDGVSDCVLVQRDTVTHAIRKCPYVSDCVCETLCVRVCTRAKGCV